MKRALIAVLAFFVVGSGLGQSPAKIRITTWNLEWFPNGSPQDAAPEKQAQRIEAAADVLKNLDSTFGFIAENALSSIPTRHHVVKRPAIFDPDRSCHRSLFKSMQQACQDLMTDPYSITPRACQDLLTGPYLISDLTSILYSILIPFIPYPLFPCPV
jgi:hypothetical protein